MRILFLTENYPPERNAAAARIHERAIRWVRAGHEMTVITCAPNFPDGRVFDGYENRWRAEETLDGVRVVRVLTYVAANAGTVRRTLDFLSFCATGTLHALAERPPDVVVANSPQFFTAVAGCLVGRLRRRPFVFELADLWPASITAVGAMRDNAFLRLMERTELALYRDAAAVVALTRSFKDDLVRRDIPPGKIAVVPNGVELERYAPRAADPELVREHGLAGKFVVGYIGTLGMAHGLVNVLDAAERLRDQPDVRYLLVGPGATREHLLAERERRGLDNVLILPPQPKERMPDYWALCDVGLAHLRDGAVFAGVIPSKIFEAMGMGLPVLLAGPEGEASRILAGDGAGLHVPPEDPQALADATLRLRDDHELRARLARASRAAAPRHTRERQARDMLRVLEMVVDGRGRLAAEAPQG